MLKEPIEGAPHQDNEEFLTGKGNKFRYFHSDDENEKQVAVDSLSDEADYHNIEISKRLSRLDEFVKIIEADDSISKPNKTNIIQAEKKRIHDGIENYLDWQHLKSEFPIFNSDFPDKPPAKALQHMADKVRPLVLDNKHVRIEDALWMHARFTDGFRRRDCSFIKEGEISKGQNIINYFGRRAGDQSPTMVFYELGDLLNNIRNGQHDGVFRNIKSRCDYVNRNSGDDKLKSQFNISFEEIINSITGIDNCSESNFVDFLQQEIPTIENMSQRGFNALLSISKYLTLMKGFHYGKANSCDIGFVFNEKFGKFTGDKESVYGQKVTGGAQPIIESMVFSVERTQENEYDGYMSFYIKEWIDEKRYGDFLLKYYMGMYFKILNDLGEDNADKIVPVYDQQGNMLWPEEISKEALKL